MRGRHDLDNLKAPVARPAEPVAPAPVSAGRLRPESLTPAAVVGLQRALGNRVTARVVQRLPLSDSQWEHISRGQIETHDSHGNKLRNPRVTGYHWTGGRNAVAEKDGTSKAGPDGLGVYVEGVQSVAEHGTGRDRKRIKKDKPSTFWPDAWSEEEIKDAITKAGTPRNNISTVALTATRPEARDMAIFSNEASRFPVLGEVEEEEEKTGRGRRGRGKDRK